MSTYHGMVADAYLAALRTELPSAASDPERQAAIKAEIDAVKRALAPAATPAARPTTDDTDGR